jgi:hypothetical protein
LDEASGIPDTEDLYRRLTRQQVNDGAPTSFGFKPRADEGNEISFYLGPPELVLQGHDGFGLARITVADVHTAGAEVRRDDSDARHVRVILPAGNAGRRVATLLSRKSVLLKTPTR